MVLSQTKVHRAKSSVSISNRYQRRSENRGNKHYTFPWYFPNFCFCRQWSLNNLYVGSASIPWVQIKVLFLKFPWGFSGLCFCTCFQPMLPVFTVCFFSSSIPFIFTMWLLSFLFCKGLFSVLSAKLFIFIVRIFLKLKLFWFFFHLKEYYQSETTVMKCIFSNGIGHVNRIFIFEIKNKKRVYWKNIESCKVQHLKICYVGL